MSELAGYVSMIHLPCKYEWVLPRDLISVLSAQYMMNNVICQSPYEIFPKTETLFDELCCRWRVEIRAE